MRAALHRAVSRLLAVASLFSKSTRRLEPTASRKEVAAKPLWPPAKAIQSLDELTNEVKSARSIEPEGRRELVKAARELLAALEPPDSNIWRVVFGTQAQAALKTAHALNIFEKFKGRRSCLDTETLSSETGVDKTLLERIMRALVVTGIFDEIGENEWMLNNRAEKLADPLFGTFAVGLSDLFSPYMEDLPSYLRSNSYANPQDKNSTLFNYAAGTPLNMFAWLKTQPEKLKAFGATMAAANSLKTQGVLLTFERLFPKEGKGPTQGLALEDVFLVDVGGGRGNVLERFRQRRPDLQGRTILQDLPEVINGREACNGVEYMVHDFFAPQPVKGAQTYFFRHIFHDWPDSACLAILRSTASAMSPESRVVIADIVLPDQNATPFSSLIDIGMMTLSGMERTKRQWHELLASVGFDIVSIRDPMPEENESASIIEAVFGSVLRE